MIGIFGRVRGLIWWSLRLISSLPMIIRFCPILRSLITRVFAIKNSLVSQFPLEFIDDYKD